MRRRSQGNKELRTTCIRSTICHGKNPHFIKMKVIRKFIWNLITRATCTCACWVATLNHKSIDNTMECNAIIKAFFYKVVKVFNSNRRFRAIQTNFNLSIICIKNSIFICNWSICKIRHLINRFSLCNRCNRFICTIIATRCGYYHHAPQ